MNQPAPGDTAGWVAYIRDNPYHNMPQPLKRADGFEPLKLLAVTERLRIWAEPDGDNDQHTQVREDIKWLLADHLRLYQEARSNEALIWYCPHGKEGPYDTWRDHAKRLETKLEAVKSVMWMAERFAHLSDVGIQCQFNTAKEILES